MNENAKLLQDVCNGCKYASTSINAALGYVKDEKMRRMMKKYSDEHENIKKKCDRLLKEEGEVEKRANPAAQMMMKLGVNMRLSMNDSKSHIAEVMINGCNMGMKAIAKKMNQRSGASGDSIDLASEIIATERSMMEDMLKYL